MSRTTICQNGIDKELKKMVDAYDRFSLGFEYEDEDLGGLPVPVEDIERTVRLSYNISNRTPSLWFDKNEDMGRFYTYLNNHKVILDKDVSISEFGSGSKHIFSLNLLLLFPYRIVF